MSTEEQFLNSRQLMTTDLCNCLTLISIFFFDSPLLRQKSVAAGFEASPHQSISICCQMLLNISLIPIYN